MQPLSYSQTLVDRYGSIMIELNALAVLVAIVCPPLAAFSAYWAGFKAGKREGYLEGRKWLRFPSKVSNEAR